MTRRERRADRLLDGIVVALVLGVVALTASAPRASPEASAPGIVVVESPAAPCSTVAGERRSACLAVARAAARP